LNPQLNADANTEDVQTLQTLNAYEQTKMKFFELLLKRFHDKSAFCRIKIMKVFTKLISENLVPQHLYIELLRSVIGRLKDTAV
jgi:adenine-specific DNA methylase